MLVARNISVRFIIHRLNKIIKDVDAVSRCADPLIHKCHVAAFNMRTDNVHLRPFTYNFAVFLDCSNPHHVHDTYILL